MNHEKLLDRRAQLQASLQNLQQSFHIVTGHLQEVDFQIAEIEREEAEALKAIEDCPATMDSLANQVETPVE